MMKNYLIYPFKVMRITQTYLGRTSHYPHTQGTRRDYPLDEGGQDTGRDWMCCPCEEVVIKRIYGVGNRGVNTIWLESTKPVLFANTTTDYMTMLATHANDDDLRKLHEGQKFKMGDKICREGTDGASGNHIHLSVGRGKMRGNGWEQNSYGKYVLTTTSGALKPEQAFWVDPYFTKVISSGGLTFKKLPAASSTPAATYKTTDVLNIRAGAGTTYAVVGQYAKGTKINVTKTTTAGGLTWGRTADGWVCLKYAKKVK